MNREYLDDSVEWDDSGRLGRLRITRMTRNDLG